MTLIHTPTTTPITPTPTSQERGHRRMKGNGNADRRTGRSTAAGAIVVEHVQQLIHEGRLRLGDRLPPERELALQIGVSRPSLRYGLRTLQAMGVIRARQGSGTYVSDGPPRLSEGPLRFLAALHGIGLSEMQEARRVLEVGAAGLAAEHAGPEQVARLAEEVAGMFASMESPREFQAHERQFHRAVAAGSGNRILATLLETVSELIGQGAEPVADPRTAAEMHRRVYRAVKARDPEKARAEMAAHMEMAHGQPAEEAADDALPALAGLPATATSAMAGLNGASS